MDINLKVRLESPELMAALLAIAEALPQIQSDAVLPIEVGQTVEPNGATDKAESKNEEPVKEEIKKEESKAIALEDDRAKLVRFHRQENKKKLRH